MSPLNYVRLSVMMFVQFFLWGSWYVLGPNYLAGLGFDGSDFGWMYSVGPIAGMISPFFVGMIADRFFATERVLGVMHLLGAVAMFAATAMMKIPLPEALAGFRPDVINLLFFAHMLCFFPTLSLTNTLAMHTMTNPETQFPMIRVFGTIGWIVAGNVLTLLKWDTSIYMFYLAAGSGLVMGIYSFTLPHTPPPSAGKAVSARQILGLDALVLLKRPSYLAFMVSSFLICIPLAFYYQLASRTVAQGGFTAPGTIMSLGQVSEIGFMLLMPLCFARLGVKWMLFVGMLAWVARYALFTIGAPAPSIWWMLLIGVVLHGICYDFFFVTGQIYTDQTASSEIRGQAQGMLVLFTLGLGMLIGAQVAGKVESANTPPETSLLQAEAAAVGTAAAKSQETASTDESRRRAFKLFREQWAKSATAADRKETEEFITRADRETKPIQDQIVAEQRRITELKQRPKGDKPQLQEAEDQLLALQTEKVEKLIEMADELAKARYQRLSEHPALIDVFTLSQRVDLLTAYQGAKSVEALRAMNWKVIWMIPAIFAGVIMVLFVLVFHDRGQPKTTDDKV
jgi:nucleoside transporter